MSPIIHELADEMQGKKIKVGKVNVELNAQIAGKYKITTIPSIFIFHKGRPIEKITGIQSKELLKQKLEAYLKRK